MTVPANPRRLMAKRLRRDSTPQEQLLWRHLRAHRFAGFKFRRQYPLPPYVLDFVCLSTRLVIEVDGGQHVERAIKDLQRDEFLMGRGFRVIRFWNNEVDQRLGDVLDEVFRTLQVIAAGKSIHPLPNPLPPAGEGVHARHR